MARLPIRPDYTGLGSPSLSRNRLQSIFQGRRDVDRVRGVDPDPAQPTAVPVPTPRPLSEYDQAAEDARSSLTGRAYLAYRDFANTIGLGGIQGTGAIARGAGLALADQAQQIPDDTGSDILDTMRQIGEIADQGIESAGQLLAPAFNSLVRNSVSDQTYRDLNAPPVFEGDLTAPSTWGLHEDASARRAFFQGLWSLGEMGPVVAGSVATGGAAGVVVGGGLGAAQSYGYGADEAASVVTAAAEDGTLQQSDVYRDHLRQGLSPDEAVARIRDDAGRFGGMLGAAAGLVGGAVLGRLAGTGVGRRPLTRIAAGTALGSVSEGAQEVAEGMGARWGANIAAEQELIRLTEGTLPEFAMGALVGGPIGGVGGLGSPSAPPPDQSEAVITPPPPDQPLLPAPPAALPPPEPDSVTADPRVQHPGYADPDAIALPEGQPDDLSGLSQILGQRLYEQFGLSPDLARTMGDDLAVAVASSGADPDAFANVPDTIRPPTPRYPGGDADALAAQAVEGVDPDIGDLTDVPDLTGRQSREPVTRIQPPDISAGADLTDVPDFDRSAQTRPDAPDVAAAPESDDTPPAPTPDTTAAQPIDVPTPMPTPDPPAPEPRPEPDNQPPSVPPASDADVSEPPAPSSVEPSSDQLEPQSARPQSRIRNAVRSALAEGQTFRDMRGVRQILDPEDVRTLDNKQIEEGTEEGVVARLRDLTPAEPEERYERAVEIYRAMPKLGTRTGRSMTDQAYSTPPPIAAVAADLAGVQDAAAVYEPTAGNGALLASANPAAVTANEINPDRAQSLREMLGSAATVTQGDALDTANRPARQSQDSVVANPPFGVVRGEDGEPLEFVLPSGGRTRQIDHAIAFSALDTMRDDGSAVLIVGSVPPQTAADDDAIIKAYRGRDKRRFYGDLYDEYNVVGHARIAGNLYSKQGASYPVDMIVIRGRNAPETKSTRSPPMVSVPDAANTWADLGRWYADMRAARDAAPPPDPTPSTTGGDVQQPPPDPVPSADQGGAAGPLAGNVSRPQAEPPVPSSPQSPQPTGEDGTSTQPEPPVDRPESQFESDTPAPEPQQPEPAQEDDDADAPQVPYQPAAQGNSLEALVPANMAEAVHRAMRTVAAAHDGNINAFVARRTGIPESEIADRLAPEQIDTVAAALSKMDRGEAYVIGHQTGVGKGRIVAALLMAAKQSNQIPVFVSEKPTLFADIVRDLADLTDDADIASRIYPTNNLRGQQAIKTVAGTITSPTEANRKKIIQHIRDTGQLPDGIDYVATTYDQNTPVKGRLPQRSADLLEIVVPQAVVVMDESHNAGGTGPSWRNVDRASFFRDIARDARAVAFSSATFSKNVNTLSLYRRAGFKGALDNPEALIEIIAKGGVPMEQYISTQMVEHGYMSRLEKSFAGIEFATTKVDVGGFDPDSIPAKSAEIFQTMLSLDKTVRNNIKAVRDAIAAEGATAVDIDRPGVERQNFTSTMHNVVNQMLLSLKAPKVAEQTIDAIDRGEKPVIYIDNTNEALMADLGRNPTYADVLDRQLRSLLRVTIKHRDDTTTQMDIPEHLLSGKTKNLREHIRKLIADMPGGDISALPIDVIRNAVTDAGHSIDEITGRSVTVNADGSTEGRDAAPAQQIERARQFNAGEIDALIINRSGSTGISLHARDAKDNDGKKRHFIIFQPAPNPDTFMQSLGRVNRTGQNVLPSYEFVFADIPAEARPVALLLRKMASLNAQTTSARTGRVQVEGLDTYNKVGDDVWAAMLEEDPEMVEQLGLENTETEDLARRATGRVAMLPPSAADIILTAVDTYFQIRLDTLVASGDNPLEQQQLDLQAVPVTETALRKGEGIGAFGGDTLAVQMSVRRIGKKQDYRETLEAAERGRQANERKDAANQLSLYALNAQDKIANRALDVMYVVEQREAGTALMLNGLPAIITGYKIGKKGSPSDISAQVRHPFGSTRIPATQLGEFELYPRSHVETDWANAHASSRELRTIITGNLLDAGNYEGAVVRYTNRDGGVETGLLAKRGLTPERLADANVTFAATDQIKRFLDAGYTIHANGPSDRQAQIIKADVGSERYRIAVVGNRGHKALTTGKDLVDRIGINFSAQQRYNRKVWYADATPEQLPLLIEAWSGASRGMKFGSDPNNDDARLKAYQIIGREPPSTRYLDVPDDIRRDTQGLEDRSPQDDGEGEEYRIVRGTPIMTDTPERMKARMQQRLVGIGIANDVSLKFVNAIQQGDKTVVGSYAKGIIKAALADGIRTIDEEAIHAMSDPTLWNRPYGLFTKSEWESLVSAARAQPDIMEEIKELYGFEGEQADREAVAKLYSDYTNRVGQPDTPVNRALAKIKRLLQSIRSALTGYVTADQVFAAVSAGNIGARSRMDSLPQDRTWIGDALTQSMSSDSILNPLALIPLHPIIRAFARNIPALHGWYEEKILMDAERYGIHEEGQDIMQQWRVLAKTDPNQAEHLNDLMYASTLSRLWPNRAPQKDTPPETQARQKELNDQYAALDAPFQTMYWRVHDFYRSLADKQESALIDNINEMASRAQNDIYDKFRRASEAAADDEQQMAAQAQRDAALENIDERVSETLIGMRASFERNRQSGPYFPLKRFGEHAVTIRSASGFLLSFSTFKREQEARAYEQDVARNPAEFGFEPSIQTAYAVMSDQNNVRNMVPGNFVANVENLIANTEMNDDTRSQLMDQVWQAYLQTMPDASMRKSRIHRKGTPGFDRNAVRTFAHATFHGGHQIARLRRLSVMTGLLADAEKATSGNARHSYLVREVRRRQDYMINPRVSPIAQTINQIGFVYYLGLTPAAAIVNLSQTTILSPAQMSARLRNTSYPVAFKAIMKASADYAKGTSSRIRDAQGIREVFESDFLDSNVLSEAEKRMISTLRERGQIERTESFALAEVSENENYIEGKWAENGRKAVNVLAWAFQKAEVFNRNVTALAAYRLARKSGMGHDAATEAAFALNYDVHFDYGNNSRPRILQNDITRVGGQFMQYSINLAVRMGIDAHDAMRGTDAETRRMGRRAFAATMGGFFLHTGLRGMPLYGMVAMMLGLFLPGEGGEDDLERLIAQAASNEDDAAGFFWNLGMGIALDGAVGAITNTNLRDRIGSPNFFFRSSNIDRSAEGDLIETVMDLAGPAVGMARNVARGVDLMGDGELWQGTEMAAPKAIKDAMRAMRWTVEGEITTRRGDALVEDYDVFDAMRTAIGFSSLSQVEQGRINRRLIRDERRIKRERSRLLKRAAKELLDGSGLSDGTIDALTQYNRTSFPGMAILPSTIRRSVRGRTDRSAATVDGVYLDPRLDRALRDAAGQSLY